MGCGTSQPLAHEGNEHGKHAQGNGHTDADGHKAGAKGDEAKAAAKANTRARRLSYVTADANGVAQADPNAVPQKPGSPQTNGGIASSTSTRARRLSYVTNDPNVTGSGKLQPDSGQPMLPGQEDDEAGESPSIQAIPASTLETESRDGSTLRVSVACMSRAGREPGFKKTNQDNCFAFEKYITEEQSLFGAMDGHGPHGHLVSGYVKQHLPIILVNHLTSDKDVKRALTSGFVEVDKSLANSRIDCEFSGSTAVVSYLKGHTLTTAWVGDSRGVMGRHSSKGWEAVDLTSDHKPTATEEKARILRSNGRVERLVDEVGQPMGPYRVWLQYAWIPGLAMSRALGDVLAHQVGVTSEPDHTTFDLTESDKFIILASDGVWEFISSKEAVDIVAQYDSVEESCRQLVDEAYQRWLTEEEGVVDDITAVVVKFIHPSA